MKLGVISDTHGLLRPEAEAALLGTDAILHAGDVGNLQIIESLQRIAPVFAVRGNVDTGPWASQLPPTLLVDLGGYSLYLLHNLQELDISPKGAGVNIVISGHTHQPAQWEKDGVLYLNPGSAGPRRFNLPVTVALLASDDMPWTAQILNLTQ